MQSILLVLEPQGNCLTRTPEPSQPQNLPALYGAQLLCFGWMLGTELHFGAARTDGMIRSSHHPMWA